ncbi:MAG: hypothetical protein JNL90_16615 [Planctomycetes bacterium]|nr:hypothetical protein [Planctomycetota bacterium]
MTTTRDDLEAYEAAFDRHAAVRAEAIDWNRLERRVRWQLGAPGRQLLVSLAVVGLMIALAIGGRPHHWLGALGLLLASVPGRVAAWRKRRRELLGLEGEVDLRALCAKEATRSRSLAVIQMVLVAVVSLLFLASGTIAWLVGKSPVPGFVAGALGLAWSVATFFVRLPRLSRESSQFEEEAAAPTASASEDDSTGAATDGR